MKFKVLSLIYLGMIWICLTPSRIYAQEETASSGTPTKIWTEAERTLLIQKLNASKQLLLKELSGLSEAQWNFKSAPDKWSVAEVVEHLGLQQDAYYREISVLTMLPTLPQYIEQVQGKDEKILNYVNQEKKDLAPWMLEPLGRWCNQEKAVAQFVRSHSKIVEFISTTKADFRSLFTFRQYAEGSLWNIRDLHQLMLTNVAHTERHINQIRKIKKQTAYPNQ